MGKKSGAKSDAPGRFQPGEDPRRGRGPKKGAPNAGRPPNEFKQSMRQLADRPAVRKRLEQLTAASNKDPELFLKAFKETADRGYGKPAQAVELSGPDGGPIPLETPAEVRERVRRELAGIAARKRP